MEEYTKINTIWKRDERGKILVGEFATPELDYLADRPWTWTEKVDGTNIRLSVTPIGDAPALQIGGRTDTAQIPVKLTSAIQQLVPAQKFVDVFTDGWASTTLYGEGYGAGVQNGGNYRPDLSFVLFDVKVGPWWLLREDVEDVAEKLDLDVVPIVDVNSLWWAHHEVKDGALRSTWNPKIPPEGLVGRPEVDMFDRMGRRILAKIKAKDYR